MRNGADDESRRVHDWLRSGAVALTGPAAGPPVVPPGSAATAATRWAAPFGVDGALLLGERAALSGAARAGSRSVGTGAPGGAARLLPLADGWAAVSCARPDDPALLGAALLATVPADAPWPALADALARTTSRELAERAALLGVAAAPLPPAPWGTACPVSGAVSEASSAGRDWAGALVVSFAALWAGPLCASLLARLGARVVTVATPARPDPTATALPAHHALLHHGTHPVVLDPGTERGRTALLDLVDRADVVIEASRPRALAGFGLSAERARGRGTTWVSVTAAGREVDRVGFGDDVAAAAGLVATGDDGAPMFVGDAIADPLAGLAAAALARAAAPGDLVDVSMTDVVRATLDGSPQRSTRPGPGGWVLDSPGGAPVCRPAHRPVPAPATATA